ncbi:hypothetical protein ONZ45_g13674 [Pleurotus djamor]|nr:hypothetical protein ONZ45_g13674 [Pleurotus djamor]
MPRDSALPARRSTHRNTANPYASRATKPATMSKEKPSLHSKSRKLKAPTRLPSPGATSFPSPSTAFSLATGPSDPDASTQARKEGEIPDVAAMEDRIKELEDEIKRLNARNNRLESKVKDLSDVVTEAVTCSICHGYAHKLHFLDDCGHHFCLACIARWFKKRLKVNMKTYIDGIPPEFIIVGDVLPPSTVEERNKIWRELHDQAIEVATGLFSYPCPVCGGSIKNLPAEAIIGRSLCDAYERTILWEMPSEEQPDEVDQVAPTEFAPLIMTNDAVLREIVVPQAYLSS